MTNPYPYDYLAVGPYGVYEIASDMADAETRRFVAAALKRGHKVERVPVAEAVERHKAFLAKAANPIAETVA